MRRVGNAVVLMLVLAPACGDESSGGGASSDTDASSGVDDDDSASMGMSMSGVGSESGMGESGVPEGCENGPLELPIAGCTPVPLPSTGDLHGDCVARINQFRLECQCLPPLERWTEAESCTDMQSGADQSTGIAHGNFGSCGESAQNTCPDWPTEGQVITGCLQLMWDEGPGEPFEAHGHYINMSSLDFTKVACGFSTSSNGIWSNQNFSR